MQGEKQEIKEKLCLYHANIRKSQLTNKTQLEVKLSFRTIDSKVFIFESLLIFVAWSTTDL